MRSARLAAALAAVLALAVRAAAHADAVTAGSLPLIDKTETIGPGITLRHVKELGQGGWQDEQFLIVQLGDPGVSADLLTAGSVASGGPLSTAVNKAGAVAGINGDFFDIGNSTAAQGPEVQSGRLQVRAFTFPTLGVRITRPGEPFDMASFGWLANYPDPAGTLPFMLDDSSVQPTLDDATYQRRLHDTGRLTGPERDLAYGRLNIDLARNAAPLIAYGNSSSYDFFSPRIGCQKYSHYGIDLAALCVKAGA